MSPPSISWANPLDDPIAVAISGGLLVLLVRLSVVTLPLGLAIAVGAAVGLAGLRHRHRHRGDRLRDRRISASIDAALVRCRELASQAEAVRLEAMARFQESSQLESLGMVQLCCERLGALPDRIEARRALLESGGGVLLSAQDLASRLKREEEALRRDTSTSLRLERQRLVDQLRRNLEAAHLGMDQRDARLLALSTRLEGIDGGLRQLQRQVDRQWPSTEATGQAVAGAVAPLDEALDQIEPLLNSGTV